MPKFILAPVTLFKMSQQSEEDAVYNLMVEEETGDLKPKVDKVEYIVQASFFFFLFKPVCIDFRRDLQ